ncbi:hypothetical protein D1007_50447 [Hordeum vulgare]|nr:hypothetical protein D1007_50447 [Hordeum vulgare]
MKKKYFYTVAANKVSTKSPVPDLTDGEWQALVQMWSTPRHKKEERKGEELSAIDLFKATHNSKKHGFSEPVKITIKLERSELQAEVMQEEMAVIKMKEEEYEAARDKELELLRKKSQEEEENQLVVEPTVEPVKWANFSRTNEKLTYLMGNSGDVEPVNLRSIMNL